MADVIHDAVDYVPPLVVEEEELYHAKTWLGKYVFCQDAKVIAIQYSCVAIGIGLVALGLSIAMRLQIAFPRHLCFHRSYELPSVCDDARHDHGDLLANRAVLRWVW